MKYTFPSYDKRYLFVLRYNGDAFQDFSLKRFLFISALQNGKQMVQEGALTALASVADSSQVFYSLLLFRFFYSSFVVNVSNFSFA